MTTTDDTPTAADLVATIRAIRKSWTEALGAGQFDLASRLQSQHAQFCDDLRLVIAHDEAQIENIRRFVLDTGTDLS